MDAVGWSVFTRPSITSGEPVNSETSLTGRPAMRIAFAVPPVESISTPLSASAFARSMRPALSETERSARRILPGPPVGAESVTSAAAAAAFWAAIFVSQPARIASDIQAFRRARSRALRATWFKVPDAALLIAET